MDGTTLDLTLFLFATFAGALVAGLSGFAFGLVVSAIWLYILTPLQTATLIIAFGLIVQGYSVWKLRGALDWQKLWPFVLGAALGVPAGVGILTWANPAQVRMGVGAFLVLCIVSMRCCGLQSRRSKLAAPRPTPASDSSTACSVASPGLPGYW